MVDKIQLCSRLTLLDLLTLVCWTRHWPRRRHVLYFLCITRRRLSDFRYSPSTKFIFRRGGGLMLC